MFYEFPADLRIEEVRDVIARANERMGKIGFIEADKGSYSVFNYLVAFSDSFPEPDTDDARLNRDYAILRECRGLIMSKATGEVLARRYHKFHNLGERPSTQPHLIDFTRPHVILEKLDGSMITPFRPDTGVRRWGTKMGATGVAIPVEDYVSLRREYEHLAESCETNDLTPIFEWCSRKQRIVIDYPNDRLVLTAIRNNRTGAYATYKTLQNYGVAYDIPVVRALPGSVENIKTFMEMTYDLKGMEGYIIRFDDGHMLKVKGREYCALHNTVELLSREKDVWALVLSDTLDDAKAFMTPEDAEAIDRFAAAVHDGIATYLAVLQAKVDAARTLVDGDIKRFALDYVETDAVPHGERGLFYMAFNGRDIATTFRKKLLAETHSQPRLDRMKPLVGSPDWHQFRPAAVALENYFR